MSRLLKILNLSIAILLVLSAVAVYWVAWRPLPETSGAWTAPVSAEARVLRDSLGVPHIQAANVEDALFLQGFVTAQDRLWQMDAIRRLAAGDLAEIIGSAALEPDLEAHRLRMRRIAEAHARDLPAADRAVLAAYARGVNHFIETHRNRLPLEFTLLGYDPRPWTVTDSILAGLQMYRNLTTSWKDEIEKELLLAGGDPHKVEQLYPSRTGSEFQPGSNSWALSGKHTASGKPILANDTHLEFSLPSTWYMVHLKAPGLNVSGVSLPGVPCVIVGHNERVAWGVTNLHYDVQDLYQEKLDPRTGRYAVPGGSEQARLEREVIRVKNGKPVDFTQWVTRHGPVIVNENGRYLALRWAAAEPASFQFPFLDLNRANNWSEFTAALARFAGPGQNFVYADVDGNIGYQATGRLPIRKGYDGSVPVDGSSGSNEWQGFIPFQELPASLNPASGVIITANQNPFPQNYQYAVHGNFAAPYRSRQIRSLLQGRESWTPEQMLAVEKDVYSAFSYFLAQQVIAAYDRGKPAGAGLSEAVSVLRNWNGQMEKGTAAPMLISLIYDRVRTAIAERASPGKGALYDHQISPAVVESILRSGDETALLNKALGDAVEQGMKLQGSSIGRWDYGQFFELTIVQPVGNQIPVAGKWFNIGPVPMSGSPTTVKQTTRRLGPSMRFVADLSAWDKSLENITAGESGEILSRHYKDQWDAYYAGKSFPMQFGTIDAKQVLTIRPQ